MSFSTTYSGIVAQLQAWLEEDGTEFTGSIDDLLGLGELRLLRDLDLGIWDTTTTTGITLASGSQTLTKPTDIVYTRQLWYNNGSGKKIFPEERTTDFCDSYWPVATAHGTPKYWAELSETQWQVVPTPSTGYTFDTRYHARPVGLSSTQTTTFLSNTAPDALLYAALAESEQFLVADERVPVWQANYADRLRAARIETRRLTRDDYTPIDASARTTDTD